MPQSPTSAAVILAAGKGTRMGSDRAKVLHPLAGRPLVTYPVNAARAAGAGRVVVVTGHQRELVRGAVLAHVCPEADAPPWLHFAVQDEQLGTGHAVLCALGALEDEAGFVLVLSGDTPMLRAETLRGLIEAARSASAGAALCTFFPEDRTGYGRVVRDPSGRAVRIVEQKDASPTELAITECNAGIYCFGAGALRDELPTLGRDNAQSEVYLTDLVELRARAGDVAAIRIEPLEASGINTQEQLASLETHVQRSAD